MLKIFNYVHNEVMEVNNIQQKGDKNVFTGLGRALGPTIEGAAKGNSSIIRAVGGALNNVVNGTGDLDKKITESLGDTSLKVITSTGRVVENTLSGFGQFFNGFLGGTGGTIKRVLMSVFLAIFFFVIFHICKLKKLIPAINLGAPSETLESITEALPSAQNEPLATIVTEDSTGLLIFDITIINDIHSLQVASMIHW